MGPSVRVFVQRPGEQTEEYRLSTPVVSLGRSSTNDIVINDPHMSRVHARLSFADGQCIATDLGSSNGIVLAGERVQQTPLVDGQRMLLGATEVWFAPEEPEPGGDTTVVLNTQEQVDDLLDNSMVSVVLPDTRHPRIVVHSPRGTSEVQLDTDVVTIGRGSENDVVVAHPAASRAHARVERRGNIFVAKDLQSRNGTWLGRGQIDEHVLSDGETLRIGDTRLVFKAAFEGDDLTVVESPTGSTRRPVLIVPGIAGSELWRGSEKLWPNVRHMLRHPGDYLLSESSPLEARGIVEQVVVVPNLITLDQYGRLRQFLEESLSYERGRDLFEFAYDWRQDLRVTARKLAEAVDSLPVDGPITIIAHSMGSLLSRYYIEFCGGQSRVERLIMLGGPHRGGVKALSGLVTGKGILPFGWLGDRVRRAFSTYPSAYQLLPTYPAVFDAGGTPVDIYEDSGWASELQRPLIKGAAEFHRELGMRCSVPAISIFGYGLKTMTRMDVDKAKPGNGWQGVSILEEPLGDTSVPESSAILPGSEIHPVRQFHGALYDDNDVKMRLKLELIRNR